MRSSRTSAARSSSRSRRSPTTTCWPASFRGRSSRPCGPKLGGEAEAWRKSSRHGYEFDADRRFALRLVWSSWPGLDQSCPFLRGSKKKLGLGVTAEVERRLKV